jgi:hypothetical protein
VQANLDTNQRQIKYIEDTTGWTQRLAQRDKGSIENFHEDAPWNFDSSKNKINNIKTDKL